MSITIIVVSIILASSIASIVVSVADSVLCGRVGLRVQGFVKLQGPDNICSLESTTCDEIPYRIHYSGLLHAALIPKP